MSKAEFKNALKLVLVHEGGKVDDPRDPGGRTNQGVTQGSYNNYLDSKGRKSRDVYKMTHEERDEIYKRRYWDTVKGDDLPPGIGYVIFDGAVNSGPAQSVKWVQRSLMNHYPGKVDGIMGMLTVEAIKGVNDHDALVAAICARRLDFLDNLKTWKTYGKGWSRRVASVKATGQAWANGSVGPKVEYIEGAEKKANLSDAKAMPAKAVGDIAGSAGGASSIGAQGLSTQLDGVKEQLSPFSTIAFVEKILLVVTIIGIVAVIGGFGYRFIAQRIESKRRDALDLNAVSRLEST